VRIMTAPRTWDGVGFIAVVTGGEGLG
jgi:hypothetical protein